jgi:hypothetical protein
VPDTGCVAGKFDTDTVPEIGWVVWKKVPVTAMLAFVTFTFWVDGKLLTETDPEIGCVDGKLPTFTESVMLLRVQVRPVVHVPDWVAATVPETGCIEGKFEIATEPLITQGDVD